MGRDKAIGLAIKSCISKGFLAEILAKNYKEVAAMLSFEYNYETHLEVMRRECLAEWHVKDLAEGHVKGREEGEQRERVKWQGVVADKDAKLERAICTRDRLPQQRIRGCACTACGEKAYGVLIPLQRGGANFSSGFSSASALASASASTSAQLQLQLQL